MESGTLLIRSSMGQKTLACLRSDFINEGFLQENLWPFCQTAKKSGWITRWLYSPGGREAGFWDLFLSSPSGFSQSNETQEVMFMKFFRHVRMKLLNSICIYIAVSYIICYPKNENEVKIHCAKKRMLVGGWNNGHMQEKCGVSSNFLFPALWCHCGCFSRRFHIRFIDPLSSSQVSSNNVFSDKQGRILQRNCVAETSARIWKNVKD